MTKRFIRKTSCNAKVKKRLEVELCGREELWGYKQIGWVPLPKPSDIVTQLPLPIYQAVLLPTNSKANVTLGNTSSSYTRKKLMGRRKKRRMKRIRRPRGRRKKQQVSNSLVSILIDNFGLNLLYRGISS